MAIITLAEAKRYLRLESDYIEEDQDIEDFIALAEEYVKDATGFTFATKVPEKAKHIVRLLTSHYYDNRAIYTTAPNVNKIPMTVNKLLAQLQYSHVEDDTNEV